MLVFYSKSDILVSLKLRVKLPLTSVRENFTKNLESHCLGLHVTLSHTVELPSSSRKNSRVSFCPDHIPEKTGEGTLKEKNCIQKSIINVCVTVFNEK